MNFEAFSKIPRIEKYNPQVLITEKLDGTNAQIAFDENGKMWVGSRNRWLHPEDSPTGCKGSDNFGFAAWCAENEEELRKLGPGRHYGEWYGHKIGRGYGLSDRRLALFNTRRWGPHNTSTPKCCEVVQILYFGPGLPRELERLTRLSLAREGSAQVPGFMQPEGAVMTIMDSLQMYKIIMDKQGPSPIEGSESP